MCVFQKVKAKLFTWVHVTQCGFPSIWAWFAGHGESVQIKVGRGPAVLQDFNGFVNEVADQCLEDPL